MFQVSWGWNRDQTSESDLYPVVSLTSLPNWCTQDPTFPPYLHTFVSSSPTNSLLNTWSLFISFPAGLTCASVSLPQATAVPGQHILVAVLPGLPTAAELFVLPYQDPTGENKRSAEDLEQVSPQVTFQLLPAV